MKYAVNLVKVSTYAKENNISVQTVYNWMKEGRVNGNTIDGVKFVILDDNEQCNENTND